MIIVDGKESSLNIGDFGNLEELVTAVMDEESMQNRVLTDILVNNENFSEIYPHQAEDLSTEEIRKVEIRTELSAKIAVEMSAELEKVARMMASGSRAIARLFREGKNTDALEMFQDLLDVTRDFMGMLGHLRESYLGAPDEEFVLKTDKFSDLISELGEVLEAGDWVLLADLLEYELAPACDSWREVGKALHKQLEANYRK